MKGELDVARQSVFEMYEIQQQNNGEGNNTDNPNFPCAELVEEIPPQSSDEHEH